MSPRAPFAEEKIRPARWPTHERRAAEERREPRAAVEAEERKQPCGCAEPAGSSFRFDDPYWDEAFDSYHDPTLRTCCRF